MNIQDLPWGFRGKILPERPLMPDAAARAWLREQRVLHVATIDEDGWPYVIPLVFVHPGEEFLCFHTGAGDGHFLRNIRRHPVVCVEASEIGPLHPGRLSACNSALFYTSLITWERVRMVKGQPTITRFFDRLIQKSGDSTLVELGYPFLDRSVL